VKPSQLVFELPHRQCWDETDFFITSRNQHALRLVTAWPDWHAPAAVIFGPPQSGKTYLANIWRNRANGEFIETSKLVEHMWTAPYAPLIIEDVDTSAFCETALFHHLNLAREHGSFILLTAQTPPGQWEISLPDLRSRIRSYPAAEIQPPDEEHLAGLLLKHFSDRQIEVAPDVISYLVTRIERSMAAAQTVAEQLDKLALAEQKKVTRAFAAKVLKDLNAGVRDGDSDDKAEGSG
jgi:chromosomal replication initiation ATPase DnaA